MTPESLRRQLEYLLPDPPDGPALVAVVRRLRRHGTARVTITLDRADASIRCDATPPRLLPVE